MRGGLWLLVTLVAGVACSSSEFPSDLGQSELDTTRLVDAPPLAHLASALDDGASLTVEDLFRVRPAYPRPPDPGPHFTEVRDDHQMLPPLAAPVPLRVLSFNVGLLDRWFPFTTVRVPHVDVRRVRAPEILLDDDWDVLLLQEVWELHDVDAFASEARERGYLIHSGERELHEEHGLVMLVREALVDPDGPDERGEVTFELQRDIENFPGPGVERGFLSWRIRHAPTGAVIDLFNTHTTAFPEYALVRESQVRQLGLAIREVPDDEIVIMGGDLNGAPYYAGDTFGEVQGEPVGDWWRNSQAYAMALHYGGLVDTHVAAGMARDVELMGMLPDYGPTFTREPFGQRGLCDSLVGGFTATDCNSLYFGQYGGTEYPGRIDFVMLRDAPSRVRVMDSAIVYDTPISGETFELSDHYGVGTTLLLASE